MCRPRLGFSYDAWSSGLHGVLMFFATCSLSWSPSIAKCPVTADTSGEPVMRNARPKARRRIAADRQRSSGCNQAPRPGSEPAVSTATADEPFPVVTATTRSSSTANSRFRQPMQVRTGAGLSRWITGQSTSEETTSRTSLLRADGRRPPRPRATSRPPPKARHQTRRRRCGCRCASPSAEPPAGRSAPPCRWPGTAGSPARQPGPRGWRRR